MRCLDTEQNETDSSLDTQIRDTNSAGHTCRHAIRSCGNEERATFLSASLLGAERTRQKVDVVVKIVSMTALPVVPKKWTATSQPTLQNKVVLARGSTFRYQAFILGGSGLRLLPTKSPHPDSNWGPKDFC